MIYRHDTPTICDGWVVRYTLKRPDDRYMRLEISASRNQVCIQDSTNITRSETIAEVKKMLDLAWAQYAHLRKNDREPLPLEVGIKHVKGSFGSSEYIDLPDPVGS